MSARDQNTRADYGASTPHGTRGALIAKVDEGSPAAREGLLAGMTIETVDGRRLRDLIDWEWESDGTTVELEGHVPRDLASTFSQDEGFDFTCTLERRMGESWGITFADCIFDGMRECRNACIFCFMSMLPRDARETLSIRDDDFRLSFLQGNFVTLTNMTEDDVDRVIEQRISPLHVSLHAVTPKVRRRIIGVHADRGIEVLERLLDAGIEFFAQIVAIPGVNDGPELVRTLEWIEERPGITSVSIVPLGYTRYQKRFESAFETGDGAARVIDATEPFRRRSRARTGRTRFQLADEFYLFSGRPFPPISDYDDFEQFEDGIGMVPSFLDEASRVDLAPIEEARGDGTGKDREGKRATGDDPAYSDAPHGDGATSRRIALLTGEAFAPILQGVIASWDVADVADVIPVENRYFGGNVDVTGLLCAVDLVRAARAWADARHHGTPPASPDPSDPGSGEVTGCTGDARRCDLVVIPEIVFNADGRTLDDKTAQEIRAQVPLPIEVVSLNVEDLVALIARFLRGGDR